MRRCFFIGTFLAGCLTLAGLFDFYDSYNRLEIQLRASRNLELPEANAIKHAYAAYGVYSALRSFGAPDALAEKLTWKLGIANEMLEKVTFGANTDSLPEVMRDFHNNWAGISAGKWLWQQEDGTGEASSGLIVIRSLLESNVLMTAHPKGFSDDDGLENPYYRVAEDWVAGRRSIISNDASMSLQRLTD